MYYEIYVDSLFLVNFVMNLYLLLLVNKVTHGTASGLRLIAGAAVGALAYLTPFWGDGYVGLRLAVGAAAGTALMLFTVFRVRGIRSFFLLLEKLVLFTFLMGGGVFFLLRRVPFLEEHGLGVLGVIGAGTVIWLLFLGSIGKRMGNKPFCKAILVTEEGVKVKAYALLDSGNSLREPISGKPVSVMDTVVFRELWKDAPEIFRVIPYHSIGKSGGILKGYLISELHLEMDGVVKICRDVYVAVSEEHISDKEGLKIIVNPALLKEKNKSDG